MASKGLMPLDSVSFFAVMLAPKAKYQTLSSCRAPMPKAAPCIASQHICSMHQGGTVYLKSRYHAATNLSALTSGANFILVLIWKNCPLKSGCKTNSNAHSVQGFLKLSPSHLLHPSCFPKLQAEGDICDAEQL